MYNFSGDVDFKADENISLLLTGQFLNVDTSQDLQVTVESEPLQTLPAWLYLFARVFCSAHCSGKTSVTFSVPVENDMLQWNCSFIDCVNWKLALPYFVDTPLTSIIGMRPITIRVAQRETKVCQFYVQRKQHCVHFH